MIDSNPRQQLPAPLGHRAARAFARHSVDRAIALRDNERGKPTSLSSRPLSSFQPS